VALESTIITHGMPWPENHVLSGRVEEIIRECGAVPATIAVIGGRLRIGIDAGEREALARRTDAVKLSRADLAFAMAEGLTGGTTVAATMIGAALAGIEVFATGGIGGVHRGARESFDISADLDELARTPVIVVSAGPKAILDIGATLEVLETKGVPVVGYRCDRLPAFWSRTSAHKAPLRLDSPEAIARFHRVRQSLGIDGGMLIANPVGEGQEIAEEDISAHILQATAEAEARGIGGKAVTPFLLSRLAELSGGASLSTNMALVENNARLAAAIAVALRRPAAAAPVR
jgi:pseudouridine-5'-phosphate glycosidase